MIKLTRIDHRLLHGQTAFSWTKFVDADCVLIANDDLLKDELKMNVMRFAKPSGIKLVMKNLEDSITALNSGVTDKYKLFVIVESVKDAYRLANACPQIKSINVGGMKASDNRKQIAKAVFIDEEDARMFKELHAKGIEVEARLVPNEDKQDVIKLIEKEM